MVSNYCLEIQNMNKTFPGVHALKDVSLSLEYGSVHALVGENGAGKSTLMKCLFGIYRPDSGFIFIDGQQVEIPNESAALNMGISMIHQELSPIPYRTITDNIWAGRFLTKGFMVDERRLYSLTKKLFDDLEFDIDPRSLARELSVSQLQAVEIAKAVSYDSKIVIMDEPTSSLTTSETEHLFQIISSLKRKRISVIYISHRLEEIFEVADTVTVMRDGATVGTWPIDELTIDSLIREMVGRDMSERFPEPISQPSDEVVLKVEDFTSADPHSFREVSFELHRGEILGIGGLVGAQRTELVEAIFGLRKIVKGRLTLAGREIANRSPREAIANGFALLTEERRATGLVPNLSVCDNALTVSYPNYSKGFLKIVQKSESRRAAERVCDELDVRMASIDQLIKNLSGGNQQKVLFGRWLLSECDILILDEPTRGVDVGAKYEIYKIIRKLVSEGKSIIMVSSEMPELLGISDRIMVMCVGRKTGELSREEASQVLVLQLATQFEPGRI